MNFVELCMKNGSTMMDYYILEFTQADLMDKLNCYQGKVKTILNELETYNLISVVKGEFNPKTKKNEKINTIYFNLK